MRDLPVLSERLPSGWTYRSRVLDQDLSLLADGVAYVLQDNLFNSLNHVFYNFLRITEDHHSFIHAEEFII